MHEMGKFSERHKVPKLTLKDIVWITQCTLKKINLIFISKSSYQDNTRSEQIHGWILPNCYWKIIATLYINSLGKKEGKLPIHFMRLALPWYQNPTKTIHTQEVLD